MATATRVNKMPSWQESGAAELVLTLDRNEVVAIRNALCSYRNAVDSGSKPTSLNASGARVYDALNPICRDNAWN